MNEDEGRAYRRGYAAGRRKTEADLEKDRQYAERSDSARRQAQLRLMCAALPFAMSQSTWKRGEVPIITIDDRVRLAKEIVDAAMDQLD